jgi:ligand-binding sensor domain-containing protein
VRAEVALCGLAWALAVAGPAAAAGAPREALVDARAGYACLSDAHAWLVGTSGGLLELGPESLEPRRVWTLLDGLPGLVTYALAATEEGVWVGTEGGLALLTRGEAGLRLAQTYPGTAIRQIAPIAGEPGGLLLATWGGGVLRLGPGARAPEGLGLKGVRVAAVSAHEGAVFAAVPDAGVHRLGRGVVPGTEGLHATALASADGALWIASPQGVFALRGGRLTLEAARPARSLAASAEGLWVGGYQGGARQLRADAAPGPVLPTPDASRVEGMGLQGSGLGCVATARGSFLRQGERWLLVATAGPPSNDVAAATEDEQGRLWVGTFDQGLAVRENGAWREVAGIPRFVNDVHGDRARNGVWVATARGLYLVTGGLASRHGPLPSEDVHSVTVTPLGRVVAGTSRGAAILDGDRWRPLAPKGPAQRAAAWAVAGGPDGSVWIGTNRGLFEWREGEDLRRLSMASSHLPDDWVTAVALRGQDLWVGTYAHGVVRLSRGADRSWSARAFGGGYVNPGGLAFVGDTLTVATMQGLHALRAGQSVLEPVTGIPVLDTTRVAPGSAGAWVATRRGMYRD